MNKDTDQPATADEARIAALEKELQSQGERIAALETFIQSLRPAHVEDDLNSILRARLNHRGAGDF